mmetsp:Transcript_32345/g.96570  ORF Transcript_32345/g.96570 Transcript_32345/m.96570 type:complete len:355 (-) Transcript_32345:242-1306(-)
MGEGKVRHRGPKSDTRFIGNKALPATLQARYKTMIVCHRYAHCEFIPNDASHPATPCKESSAAEIGNQAVLTAYALASQPVQTQLHHVQPKGGCITSSQKAAASQPAKKVGTSWPAQKRAHHSQPKRAAASSWPAKERPVSKLPGVHDVVGVQRSFDGAHHGQRHRPVLLCEVAQLAVSDAVLASARATHLQSQLHNRIARCLPVGHRVWVIHVEHQQHVEVSVADVADERRKHAVAHDRRLCALHRLCQTADGHAYVRREATQPWACCQRRPIRGVARMPQACSLLWERCPLEAGAPHIRRQLIHKRGLLLDACLCSVELEEERRGWLEVGLGVCVDCRDGEAVEQLHARHRH